ncbi:MAG: hypothetical protein MHM6MM_005234 [Cercozoa sp. M6MM]
MKLLRVSLLAFMASLSTVRADKCPDGMFLDKANLQDACDTFKEGWDDSCKTACKECASMLTTHVKQAKRDFDGYFQCHLFTNKEKTEPLCQLGWVGGGLKKKKCELYAEVDASIVAEDDVSAIRFDRCTDECTTRKENDKDYFMCGQTLTSLNEPATIVQQEEDCSSAVTASAAGAFGVSVALLTLRH